MRLNILLVIAWFFTSQLAVAGVLDALKSDPPKSEPQSDVERLAAKNAAAEKASKKKAKKPRAGATKMTSLYGVKAGGGVALGIVDQKGTWIDGSAGLYKRLSPSVNLGFDVSTAQGLTEAMVGCSYNRRITAFGAGPSYHTQIQGHAWFDAGLNAGYAMFWAAGECDTETPMVFEKSNVEAGSIYVEPSAGASYWWGRLAVGPEFRKPIFFGPHWLVKDARQLGEFFLNAKYTF